MQQREIIMFLQKDLRKVLKKTTGTIFKYVSLDIKIEYTMPGT